MDKKFLIYKITNTINHKTYIGLHSTFNIKDSYMGSGTNICNAIKKYGKENFIKEILFVFDNKDEMCEMEANLVNKDYIKRKDTYNIILGGGIGTLNTTTVKDEYGNIMQVNIKDERYLKGDLVGVTKGMVKIIDENDKCFMVKIDDPKILSGEYKYPWLNKINVKDKEDNTFQIDKDDPRYLIGELVGIWKGKKHSEKTKKKMSETAKRRLKNPKNNTQYGTCWIYNEELKESKKCKKEDIQQWLDKGWIKGRKIKFK